MRRNFLLVSLMVGFTFLFTSGMVLLLAQEKAGEEKTEPKVETYGEKVVNADTVHICPLLDQPEKYKGKEVIIEGKISEECPFGGNFVIQCLHMKDSMIKTYVAENIGPIPQRVGYNVRVLAMVKVSEDGPRLEAKGIEIWKPEQEEVIYTCPMHPEVQQDKTGTCPKCKMKLVPKEKVKEEVMYTCPMHPEVQQDKPGTCPKCKMKLVPKKKSNDESECCQPTKESCKSYCCSIR